MHSETVENTAKVASCWFFI